jgi:hypothetical protein
MKEEDLKDREDRYGRGVTRTEIIKYILKFADGVEEPKIRGYLRDEFNISAMRNIKTHLEKLENENYIVKKAAPGEANIWIINYDNFELISSFIAREMIQNETRYKKEDTLSIFNAKGTQKFIHHHIPHLNAETADSGMFGLLLETYVFNEFVKSPTKYDPYIRRFCQLITISPTLYCSFFSDSSKLHIMAGVAFDTVEISPKWAGYIEFRPFIYKILIPCVIDAINYPEQKPLISEFLYEIDKFGFKNPDDFVFHKIYRALLDRYETLQKELDTALNW